MHPFPLALYMAPTYFRLKSMMLAGIKLLFTHRRRLPDYSIPEEIHGENSRPGDIGSICSRARKKSSV